MLDDLDDSCVIDLTKEYYSKLCTLTSCKSPTSDLLEFEMKSSCKKDQTSNLGMWQIYYACESKNSSYNETNETKDNSSDSVIFDEVQTTSDNQSIFGKVGTTEKSINDTEDSSNYNEGQLVESTNLVPTARVINDVDEDMTMGSFEEDNFDLQSSTHLKGFKADMNIQDGPETDTERSTVSLFKDILEFSNITKESLIKMPDSSTILEDAFVSYTSKQQLDDEQTTKDPEISFFENSTTSFTFSNAERNEETTIPLHTITKQKILVEVGTPDRSAGINETESNTRDKPKMKELSLDEMKTMAFAAVEDKEESTFNKNWENLTAPLVK